MSLDKILETEYSERFNELCKRSMINSYFKYGPLAENYSKEKTMDAVANIEIRLDMYKKTGNKEYLVDVSCFSMIEFMHPQHPNAHYKGTDGGCPVAGFGVNQMKEFDKY